MSGQDVEIQVRNISKRFGKVTVVDDVSFDVKDGDVVGLLGPSGCGKTTILRCIAGLEDIDAGEIMLGGKIASSKEKRIFVPPEKRKVGLVFQSYALWPHMTVKQNLAYCLKNVPKDVKERKIEGALELVSLSEIASRYPSQLSGGQQQRVALARSLCYEPGMILLDEPLSNLDFKERERVRGELRTLLKRIGITAVFVTHDQEEAFVISDRVILLNKGRMVQTGTPDELYSSPSNLFAAQFIGKANIFKATFMGPSGDGSGAMLAVPELGKDLYCDAEGGVPRDTSMVAVRFNEISMSEAPDHDDSNVVEGTLSSKEYRGSVTDYRVKVGGANVGVTTHPFCSNNDEPQVGARVYLRIPPAAVKPLKS